jgi:recombination protein RecA
VDSEKQQRLNESLAALRQEWGEAVVRRLGDAGTHSPVAHRPTGFVLLDKALDVGGIPVGQLTHLCGTPTSGATTLAYKILGQASSEAVVYVDCPHTFDADYAARCGVDTANLLLIQPLSVDHALESLYALVDTAAVAVLALDPRKQKLRLDRAALRRLMTALHRSRCALVVVEPMSTPIIADHAAVRLHLQVARWLMRRQEVNGYRTQVRILKNQFGRSGHHLSLVIGFALVVKGDGT